MNSFAHDCDDDDDCINQGSVYTIYARVQDPRLDYQLCLLPVSISLQLSALTLFEIYSARSLYVQCQRAQHKMTTWLRNLGHISAISELFARPCSSFSQSAIAQQCQTA